MNSRFTDQAYLEDEQYRDDSNLRARIELHRRFRPNPEPWHRWVFDRLDFPRRGPDPRGRVRTRRAVGAEQRPDPGGWQTDACRPLARDGRGGARGARRACRRTGWRTSRTCRSRTRRSTASSRTTCSTTCRTGRAPSAEISSVLGPGGGFFYARPTAASISEEIKALYADEERSWEFRWRTRATSCARSSATFELELHPGGLEVTEVEPLLAFVPQHGPRVTAKRTRSSAEIERDGVFRVTKSGGLFACRKH